MNRTPEWTGVQWAGWLFLALFALAALIGGGARGDINSVAILRPVAMFVGVLSLAVMTRETARAYWPLVLVGVLALLWMALQQMPLPPSIWASLPGQAPYFEAARVVGMADQWRPISVVPSQTSNAFYAAIVPFAALLLFMVAPEHSRRYALYGIAGFGVLSALFGLMQLGVGADSPLYFYAITNEGRPVGLFANRNHQAMLLACLPPIFAYVAMTLGRSRTLPYLLAALTLMLAILIFALGSRAGLILYGLSCLSVFVMLPKPVTEALPGPSSLKAHFWIIYPAIVAGIFASITLVATRTVAWQRLVAMDTEQELRAEVQPTIVQMVADFFPVGAGGGTFPYGYYFYEPAEMLSANYLNHAHNDYLEVAYAYGLPGILLVAFLIIAVGRAAWTAWFDKSDWERMLAARACLIGFVILLVGSAADYPLRVPSLAVAATIFAAMQFRWRQTTPA